MPNQGSVHVSGMTGPLRLQDAMGRQVPVESTGPMNGQERQVRIFDPAPGMYYLSDDVGSGSGVRVLVTL
ncbi:MAG: hypothetical protein IT229_04810 [Flavobacteriales bacterium]|nr:hypothetical protein [Flavobacteriales bacterium]